MDCLKKYNTYRLNDFPGFPAQVSYNFLSRTPATLTARLHSFTKHFSNNVSVSFETHKESRPGSINLTFPKKSYGQGNLNDLLVEGISSFSFVDQRLNCIYQDGG